MEQPTAKKTRSLQTDKKRRVACAINRNAVREILRNGSQRKEDMTKQEVIEIMNELDPFTVHLNDIPDWGRETIRNVYSRRKN